MERAKENGYLLLNNVRDTLQSYSTSLLWKRNKDCFLRVRVVTGDKRGAGTDANVYFALRDASGKVSKTIKPGCFLRDDHERGDTTTVNVDSDVGVTPPIVGINVWRDDFGNFSLGRHMNTLFFGGKRRGSSDWFLDRVEVELIEDYKSDGNSGFSHIKEKIWIFPVHRWIEFGVTYSFSIYDCCLPQDDPRTEFRLRELQQKKKQYEYVQKIPNGPVQIESLPTDENFSEKFFWTFVQKKASLMMTTGLINWSSCSPVSSFESLKGIFKKCLSLPLAYEHWREDWWFGLQRLQGADATLLSLCQELPAEFSEEDFSGLLNGQTIDTAIEQKKIFLCDLIILDGLSCRNSMEVAAPKALFHLNEKEELLPLAICLRRGRTDNPVYTPNDDTNTWLMAKMFYNNAEAQHHQSLSHLGLTHLLMEGVCACTHRNLSPSHPIFKLLAPHFLYLIALNRRGEEKLINPGGWVDSTMTQAVNGMVELIGRGFQKFDFTRLNPIKEINARRLLDGRILPHYPYRDDVVDVYKAIHNYVSSIVDNYYSSSDVLKEDSEIKCWRHEMTTFAPEGLGLKNVPGDDSVGFENADQLKEVLSGIISTCTLGHAAANSQQYEQYAFIPNYPGTLTRDPPKEKRRWSEEGLLALLPSKEVALDIIVITNLLSTPITNKLGDFEVQYLFHPNDVTALERFRCELEKISEKIRERNTTRRIKYTDLDPACLPNSISI